MEITLSKIAIGLFAAFCTGASKSGVPGFGLFSVVVMAMVFGTQAKLSTGAVLPLLIAADLLAVPLYFRACDWSKIRLLFPAVLVGFVIGAIVLKTIDDGVFCFILGIFVLAMTIFEQVRMRFGWNKFPHSGWFAWSMGILGGTSTVIANAAGPVMILYVTALGFSKEKLMGTITIFFFLVNITKLPIVSSLGLISGESLLFDLYLLPGIIVGSLVGRRVYRVIPEQFFKPMIMVLNIVAAIMLLL